MSASLPAHLPLHIAALLIPYLSPPDLFRAQRVCKYWQAIFTSDDLSKIALRTYGALSREQYYCSHNDFSEQENSFQYFRNFSVRTQGLSRGVPHQELQFLTSRNWAGDFVWCFAQNFLIYLAPEPEYRSGITVVYFDWKYGRYTKGFIEMGLNNQGPQLSVYSIRLMKFIGKTLVVEHTKDSKRPDVTHNLRYARHVQAFRLDPPVCSKDGMSEIGITKLSEFQTFEFRHIDYTSIITTDHSDTHYAALNTKVCARAENNGLGLYVWDIQTGKLIWTINKALFISNGPPRFRTRNPQTMKSLMFLDDNHIAVAWSDPRNGFKWDKQVAVDQKDEDAGKGFMLYLSTFKLDQGTTDERGVIIALEDDCIHNTVTRMKDDEMLIHHNYHIFWNLFRQTGPKLSFREKSETKVFLNLWGKKQSLRGKNNMNLPDDAEIPAEIEQAFQYHLLPDNQEPGELSCHAVFTHVNEEIHASDKDFDDLPPPISEEIPIDSSFFLNSISLDGSSYDLAWCGHSTMCFGTRLMAYDLRIRNFQPSRSPFSVQPPDQAVHNHLSYSSYLKQILDPTEKRIIPSIRRNVVGGIDKNLGAGDVVGDERMAVFTDLKEQRALANLIVNIWEPIKFDEYETVTREKMQDITQETQVA